MASKFQIPIAFKSDPRGLKEAESAVSGFGKKLLGIGALVGGAFAIRGIANFAKESVLGAERAAQFDSILKQVAKTTGVFGSDVDAATSRMIKFADAHEMVIGVEAELIKETQGVLLSFKAVGASGNEVGGVFDRATKAAFDMAAVLKTDARGSAVQLGKALENPIRGVTALAKAGTTFTDQQKEQIRVLQESGDLLGAQTIILNEVESQYGGAAEAAALSSAKITLAFGQVQDALGNALAPSFERFAKFFIEEVVPPLTQFFEVDFPVMIASFAGAGDGLAESFAPIGAALREAFKIEDDVSFLEGLLDKIATLPENDMFMNFVESIVLLTPGLLELLPHFTELVINLVPLLILALPFLTSLLGGLSKIFGEVADEVDDATVNTGDWNRQLADVASAVVTNLPVLGSWVRGYLDIANAVMDAIRAVERWLGLTGGNVDLTTSETSARGRRALGGPVSAGDSYLVGERGPEIFTPGAGGFITPNDRMGGGGGATINITVNAGMGANGAVLGREIVNAIKRYERTSGPVFASA